MSLPPADRYDLQRFLDAQQSLYASVCSELRQGQKTSHWMWFIFPQLQGLGTSSTARRYAISCLNEAREYLAHQTLGARLRECTRLVCDVSGRTAEEIFGHTDSMKFRSSMTLFAHTAPDEPLFAGALRMYFAGEPDARTVALLQVVKDR